MREYDAVDAAYYDYYSTGLEGDVEFYVEEAQSAGSPVLELGCGTGRILIPIAEAGVKIVGLDHAPAMLAVAKRNIRALEPKIRRRIRLVQADMREFRLGQRFNLILIPYRAFLHLLTIEDQKQALKHIRAHLAENGRLILNIFDPRPDIIAAHLGPLGAALKKQDEFIRFETGHRVIVWDTRRYDPGRQLLEQYFIFEELDAAGQVISKTYSSYTIRYIYRYEMQHLLELCGLRVQALYGDFQRGPYQPGGEQIWVATRA